MFVPHLGCPHGCVFCDQRGISGTSVPPSPEDAYSQIYDAMQKLPHGEAVQVAFYGGSFTAVPVQLQNALLDAGNRALEGSGKIRVSTRPDYINDEIVSRLISQNVTTIELGAQSMDAGVLSASMRGHTAEHTRSAAKAVKNGGAELILQMMTGLPGDTPEKSLSTARELIALKPAGVRIYPTVIIHGTRLHELWLKGLYAEHTVTDAVELCSALVPMFEAASIPVIRLGLNPSDGLTAGDAVAGAYHPAFGELVSSRIYLGEARELLKNAKAERGSDVVLSVRKGQLSAAIGQRRCNIEALTHDLGLLSLKIIECDEQKDKILVVSVDCRRDM